MMSSPSATSSALFLNPVQLLDYTRFAAAEVAGGRYPYVRYDESERWHQRLYRDRRVDLWLISWLPAQGTQLHDHGGSAGAFTVLTGELSEAISAPTAGGARLVERVRRAGDGVGFGPRYVHDVRNLSDRPAVSVHAYSAAADQHDLLRHRPGRQAEPAAHGGHRRPRAGRPATRPGHARGMTGAEPGDRELDEAARPAATGPRYGGVDELLAAARAGLVRLQPAEAAAELAAGARLVDIRPAWQRAVEGEIAGALVIERNHLEWRLHPESTARVPAAQPGQRWIVACSQGYTSSLAAAALRSLGIDATDLVGGVQRWRADGLPVRTGVTRVGQVVGEQPSVDLGDLAGPHVEDESGH